jgi:formate dehydrogenase assembly factor FdhD
LAPQVVGLLAWSEHGDGPTALALRTAETAGITIVGIVRDDGLEVFTRADRVATPRG